jgi:hypothetical protein
MMGTVGIGATGQGRSFLDSFRRITLPVCCPVPSRYGSVAIAEANNGFCHLFRSPFPLLPPFPLHLFRSLFVKYLPSSFVAFPSLGNWTPSVCLRSAALIGTQKGATAYAWRNGRSARPDAHFVAGSRHQYDRSALVDAKVKAERPCPVIVSDLIRPFQVRGCAEPWPLSDDYPYLRFIRGLVNIYPFLFIQENIYRRMKVQERKDIAFHMYFAQPHGLKEDALSEVGMNRFQQKAQYRETYARERRAPKNHPLAIVSSHRIHPIFVSEAQHPRYRIHATGRQRTVPTPGSEVESVGCSLK